MATHCSKAVYNTQIDHFGTRKHLKCPEKMKGTAWPGSNSEVYGEISTAFDPVKPVRFPSPVSAISYLSVIDCKHIYAHALRIAE